uniref:SPRY domain n=1 Tax=Meloidogyne incognita TaxID=6306 RepID=A0A914LD50_MELIC
MKNNVQKINDEDVKQLKDENVRKDEKINSLEVEIKKVNELLEKMIVELTVKEIFKCLNFVKIENKWSEIDSDIKCCDNICINTNNPVGVCVNGFGNIIDDENIKYVKHLHGGYNRVFAIYGKNSFNNPQYWLNYSLYYFEITCKFENGMNNAGKLVYIGLKNCSTKKYIYYSAYDHKIVTEKDQFQLSTPFNNNDIFGCGIAYPSTNMTNKFPYVFFTQNGKQIGKGVLLNEKFGSYKPYIWLICCSVETNFANDLEAKPFNYDISKHSIHKEFY